jgi:hypothetical protein
MAGLLKVAEDYSRSGDLPRKARKPADGEPSETEPASLADPQGTKAPARCRQFQDFNGDFVIR